MSEEIRKLIVVDAESADTMRTFDDRVALFGPDGAPLLFTGFQTSQPTGWEENTGMMARSTFNANTATLDETAQRLAALINDLIDCGVIETPAP